MQTPIAVRARCSAFRQGCQGGLTLQRSDATVPRRCHIESTRSLLPGKDEVEGS